MKAKAPAPNAHPLLKFAHSHMRIRGVSMAQAARDSGVSYNTIKEAMQGRSNISLASAEALLNYLGYSIKPSGCRYE